MLYCKKRKQTKGGIQHFPRTRPFLIIIQTMNARRQTQQPGTSIIIPRQDPGLPQSLKQSYAKVREDFTNTEKAPTRASSWLKAATTAFTFKTLLRHYAKRALTPWSLNVKLGPRRNYHEGRAAIRHYADQPARPLWPSRGLLHDFTTSPMDRLQHQTRAQLCSWLH